MLVARAVELGIDFDPSNKGAQHPSDADRDALDVAAPEAWLRTALEAPDDTIDAPPGAGGVKGGGGRLGPERPPWG
ncbi:MAG TPA: hypothetical protein VMT25_06620 [Thermoanaerobaculia bacterium]|nr:hypothetical protein [Thermoanaerobaculia bacterium]